MTVSSNLQDEQYNDSIKKFGRYAESVTWQVICKMNNIMTVSRNSEGKQNQ